MMAELINRRALKAETRELLLDAQVSPKAFVALYLVLLLALNLVDSLTGTGILSTFVSILVTLLAVVLEAGFIFYCMAVRQGERAEFLALFDGFSFAGKVIGLSLLRYLYTYLWSMLFVIPGIIAAYRYRFALYNLCENPEMGIFEALNMSKRQTLGYKGQLFTLDLSYLGWTLLASVPTLIQNFLYYSAAFRMFFDYLASPSGILMTPDASVLLLQSWAWTLITGVWVVAVTMFYLPHYYCAQLTLFEEAKAACPSRRGADGLGGL